MAIQRNNPINIDYQVPADVAGFAGQRAAISEAEAISQNQSRKMAETQDIVKASLAAQDTFARIKHTEMQIELDKQKAAHTAQIQNAELDHQMNIDWNKMQNEWDLLPLEKRRMELANEAQDIENEWAADEAKAGLEGTELDNAAKRKQLEDSKNLGAYERSKREYVKGGGAPKDFVWGGPAFTTPEGLQGRKAIDTRMDGESAAQRNQEEADEYNGIYGKLTEAQQDAIDDATDALVKGNVGISPFGGKRTYFNANGNGFSENGQDVLRRLDKQTAIKLTHAEKAHLKASTDATEKSWFEKIGNSGSIVLTEAGLRQYEGRREAVKTMWRATERSVIDGKETIKYERRSAAVQEAVDKGLDAFYKSPAGLTGQEPDLDAIKALAIEQKGFDVSQLARDTVISRMESGDTLYIRNPDGKIEIIDPSRVSAGADGIRGTSDDEIAGADGGGDDTSASSSTQLATSMSSSQEYHTAEGDEQLLGYNNMTPKGLTTESGGGYLASDFNNGVLPHIGSIMDRLQLSANKVDPLVADTYEGKGYGATPEEAKEIADLLKQRYIDPVPKTEGGSDERYVSERESVNMAVDYYSDKYVNPHRVKLAGLLGMNDYLDTASEGSPLLPFGWGGHAPGTVNQTADREADEIISTEIGDSTVRLKGGKVMKIRDFVNLPANEMLGARLYIPYALENADDGSEPNEPTEGNIHGKGRRRTWDSGKNKKVGVTLFPYHFKDDIGDIKTTLTQLIENGDHLTGLGNKFLRYKDGEYD